MATMSSDLCFAHPTDPSQIGYKHSWIRLVEHYLVHHLSWMWHIEYG